MKRAAVGLFALFAAQALAANPIVTRAIQRYEDGDYAAVVKLLTPAIAAGIADAADLAQARTYLAAAQFAAGDRAGAEKTLDALLVASPGAQVDSASLPPPFVRLFEERKAKLKPGPVASKPEPKPEPKPDPTPEPKPEPKPEGKPEPEPEPKKEPPPAVAAPAAPSDGSWPVAPGLYVGGTVDPLGAVFGGEAAVALDVGPRFSARVGLTLSNMPALRLSGAFRLAFIDRVGLLLSARGLLCPWYPTGVVGGGGVGAHLWVRIFKPLDLVVGGAVELYGAPTGVVFAPLINLGVEAHLGR